MSEQQIQAILRELLRADMSPAEDDDQEELDTLLEVYHV